MKSFIQKFGITIYILLLSAHLYAQVLGDQFSTVQLITKALLLPTLIAFLAAQDYSETAPKGKWLVGIGLFGSFLGDVLLTNEKYFIAGMVAFMSTQSMGSLIYPILVYMILICTAAIKAFRAALNEKTNLIAQLFWFPGMLFFITSDAVLAFNKFQWSIHSPIAHIGLVTMMTYGVAQLLLAKGFQLYFKK